MALRRPSIQCQRSWRLPPLASLAVLDVILVVTATVLTRAHHNLACALREAGAA
ncbi:hypothetical protein MTP10_27100 [Nonomuraea sp. 3-1Str]|uniref:hypothetical protein n=1 Tax=Nonomuraea sp. 3-1Str TaxID=2929801 RepID=UPI00285B851F|nr:hypothetical protein [Nonomuraea sp. 3-1Str]MDR8412386.1 hypothetical protein [Nonomuraea sp. 3-1Str]